MKINTDMIKRYDTKGADVEIITVPIAFALVTILLLVASLYSDAEFTAERSSIQAESLNQYETYATTAALIQNQSFMNDLTKLSYDNDQQYTQSATGALENVLEEGSYEPAYRAVFRDLGGSGEDEVLRVENGQKSFSYAEIYVASPKTNKYSLTVGMKR